ncbi:BTAD domain-containing putative transcriptional regulator [Streptomyces sp. NPDC091289]|uniref:BTAD domain-containing putative transcriptional regulator n=1 Tax=Streptomyces sp. NPDC091289 TaxID=3365989 RepID=UPI003820BD79
MVPTRELLGALWPDRTPPTTARKILQNAVWGLRGSLAADGADRHGELLLTKAPGYVMQVDRDQVDLHLFNRRVQEGRTALQSDSPARAASILRDAVALWHGQALSDLVESGINWPELDAAENSRLDAMEDYFEAELRCGRHQSTLGALESMVEAQPLRERLCGQLMLALYRCGRQADALNVYSRVRASLIEDLGLEPRRELQSLQQAILTQDSTLSSPEVPSPTPELVPTDTGPVQEHAPARPAQQRFATAASEPSPTYDTQVHAYADRREDPLPDTSAPATRARVRMQRTDSVIQHRPVSVVLVTTGLRAPAGGRTQGTDELRDRLTGRIRDLVEELGGSVISSIGSTQLAVFGSGPEGQGHAERAVCAVLAVRDEFHTAPTVTPLDRSARRAAEATTVYAAVSTGEALLRYEGDRSGAVRSADGALLDECQSLLSRASAGEIWVCGNTRHLTASEYSFVSVSDSPQAWKVNWSRPRAERPVPTAGVVDREIELDLLRGMLERVRHRETPHVVTIVGEPGIGKSRLLKEFERRSMGQPIATWFLVPSGPDRDGRQTYGPRPFELRRSPLFDPYESETQEFDLTQALKSGHNPLKSLARECPLVMFVDDLHDADNALLDFIGMMGSEVTRVPLFVVATASPQLFHRRPGWGGGRPHFTTISIDPPVISRRTMVSPAAGSSGRPLPGLADCTP